MSGRFLFLFLFLFLFSFPVNGKKEGKNALFTIEEMKEENENSFFSFLSFLSSSSLSSSSSSPPFFSSSSSRFVLGLSDILKRKYVDFDTTFDPTIQQTIQQTNSTSPKEIKERIKERAKERVEERRRERGKGERRERKREGIAICFQPVMNLALPFVLRNVLLSLPDRWDVVVVMKENKEEQEERIQEREEETKWEERGEEGRKERREQKRKEREEKRKRKEKGEKGENWKILKEIEKNLSENNLLGQKRLFILEILPFNFDRGMYSCYLANFDFYLDFPAEHILFFQTDTLILRKDDGKNDLQQDRFHFLRDFYQFPMIGAPWIWRKCGHLGWDTDKLCRDSGNGGLSLRRRSAMLYYTDQMKKLGFPAHYSENKCRAEDLSLVKMMDKSSSSISLLPPRDVGRRFSVEAIRFSSPWGVHRPWREVGPEWCDHFPEVFFLSKLNEKEVDFETLRELRDWFEYVGLDSSLFERFERSVLEGEPQNKTSEVSRLQLLFQKVKFEKKKTIFSWEKLMQKSGRLVANPDDEWFSNDNYNIYHNEPITRLFSDTWWNDREKKRYGFWSFFDF